MFDLGAIDRQQFRSTFLNTIPIKTSALVDELRNDPAGRGYAAAKSDLERWDLLCLPYEVPNPEPQDYIYPTVEIDPVTLKALVADGLITIEKFEAAQADVREQKKVPNPAWPATVMQTPRSDEVLGVGMVPSLEEIAEAVA